MTTAPHSTRTGGSAPDTTASTVTWELVHAEPGALVYAVPGAELPVNPMMRRTASGSTPAGWTPSGLPEHTATSHPHEFDHPVLHYAGYLGRVGLLATVLGVGAAVAATPGIAAAKPVDTTGSSSEPAPAPRAGSRKEHAPSTAARQHSTPSAVRSSGGAHTSTTGTPVPTTASDAPRHPASAAPAQTVAKPGAGSRHTDSSSPGILGSKAARPTNEVQPTPAPRPRPTSVSAEEPATSSPATSATTAAETITAPPVAAPTPRLASRIVSAALAPFSSPTAAPAAQAAQTPVVYGLFAWLRHTFGGQAGTQASNPTGNTQVDNPPSPGTAGVAGHANGTVAGDLHVTDIDPDTAVYTVVGGPSRGTVSLNRTTGAFTYTPFQTGRGDAKTALVHDTFTVTVDDGHGVTATVPVSVDIDPTSAVPVTLAVSHSEGPVHVSVIVTNHETDPVTYLVVHDPARGTLTKAADGYTFTPHTESAPATTATDLLADSTAAAPAAAVKSAATKPVSAATTAVTKAVTPSTPAYFPTAGWLWNPIPANPTVAANSATWVSYLSASSGQRVADLYNYGVTLVPASAITTSTPRYSVKLSNVGSWGKTPYGSYTIPLPRGTMIPPGSDGQVAVLDPVTGEAFSIWQAKYNSKTNTWSGTWGGATPLNGNGVDQSGSGTGAGISRYAGVVTTAEFSAAVAADTGLNHALVFSTNIAGSGFVGPAIQSDGTNLAGVATPIPEGYRIQLDPSINVDAIPNITPGEKVIAKTLQTYGAYVVDQGGATMAFAFQTAPNATATNPGTAYTNAGFAWDYYNMANIPWSQLRVLAA